MPYVPQLLPCDGCGQLADSQHISLRLQRLEWATRFRPVHIQSLLVSAISPPRNDEFLYSPDDRFTGEARDILDAVQVETQGRTAESVLTEFQKRGLMLIHVLECPLSAGSSPPEGQLLLERQIAAVVTRLRRSLKPKRLLLLSSDMRFVAEKLRQTDLGCAVYPASGDTFFHSSSPTAAEFQAFREAMEAPHAQTP